jgi:hypothetical protein
MARTIAAAIVLSVLAAAPPSAHRLDEYLQSARISLERESIALEIDLTPGASVAAVVVSAIDRDGDRVITPAEASGYGRDVLRDVVLLLDGRAVPLTLTHVEVPTIDEMSDGLGTIQVRASAAVPRLASGLRVVSFRNDHRPQGSVYQVNALVPAAADVRVGAQRRDPLQREVRVEYQVRPSWAARLLWAGLGVLGVALLFGIRRRSRRSPPVFMSSEWLHSAER